MTIARRTFATLSTALVLALCAGFVTVSTALAETPEPTLGLVALQAKLDASPTKTVPGYFKTVLRGSTIETIPCTVEAITGETSPDSSLIMFKASGDAISDIGGIAEGMSGSPIYVDDSGVDKVIGAVSYGSEFTVGGTGLATPIEAMLQLQQDYPPQVQPFSQPVITPDGTIDRVIVVPNPEDFKGASEQGALVAKPLSTVFIGGLRPSSKAFADLKAELAAKGITVTPRTAPGAGTSSLSTPLVAGASVASLASRGDLWLGSLGTVTYASGDDVLAYGHPDNWLGETTEFMCNATIDGVWPSQQAPSKIGRPAALRGTVEQDRRAGILGRLDTYPAETTVTVHAVNTDTGKTADSAVYFPRALVSKGLLGPRAFEAATYVAGSDLFDQDYVGGSAEITTTIVFGDGVHTYQVVLPDFVDDPSALLDAVTMDTVSVVDSLDGLIPADLEKVDIVSVDVQERFTKHRMAAQILSIDAPDGLKTGPNRIVVQLAQHGVSDTRTVETTLTIPAGMALHGELSAVSASSIGDGFEAANVADVADTLSDWMPGNTMWVFYSSHSYDQDSDSYDLESEDATVSTPWALQGDATAMVTSIAAAARPSTIGYGGSSTISGYIAANYYSLPPTAAIYATDAGQPQERLLGIAEVNYTGSGGQFVFSTGHLTSNTRIHIHTDAVPQYSDYGDGGATSGDAYVQVNVQAAVSLSASSKAVKSGQKVTLGSLVSPATAAGGTVTFEYYDSGHKAWRKIASKTLVAGGSRATAVTPWKVLKGTHKVRARYLGGALNASGSSGVVQIKGK